MVRRRHGGTQGSCECAFPGGLPFESVLMGDMLEQ